MTRRRNCLFLLPAMKETTILLTKTAKLRSHWRKDATTHKKPTRSSQQKKDGEGCRTPPPTERDTIILTIYFEGGMKETTINPTYNDRQLTGGKMLLNKNYAKLAEDNTWLGTHAATTSGKKRYLQLREPVPPRLTGDSAHLRG